MTAGFTDDDLDLLFTAASDEARIAVAVSGGGDSMALLHLADRWTRRRGTALQALTVDHGLRTESAAEAAMVKAFCARRGIAHETLVWRSDGTGNLSAKAREGRYRTMADACTARGIAALLTGHTLDDQAETVLLRLGRGSGVDGLAGMRPVTALWGLRILRPLLDMPRAPLRGILAAEDIPWADDPTNEDRDYARIRARDALPALADTGITPARLAATARSMHEARVVLDACADAFRAQHCTVSPLGYITLPPASLRDAPVETARRVFARLLCEVSGAPYRPRLDALAALMDRATRPGFGGATLHGCRVDIPGGMLVVQREPRACTAIASPARGGLWDGRFHVALPPDPPPGTRIAATGEAGLRHLKRAKAPLPPGWTAAPRPARACTPALWQGDTPLAIPLAGYAATPAASECRAVAVRHEAAAAVDPADEAFI